MQQINANRGRVGCDGVYREWREIEMMFKVTYGQDILDRLRVLLDQELKKPKREAKKVDLLEWCIENTPHWLVDSPEELEKVVARVNVDYKKLLKNDKKWRKELQAAYDYDHKKLLDLANGLYVKTCPYCNMQYTLFLQGHTRTKTMAKFQFDHFYPRSKYPMLSMSLYNLIPSCASCNQGKSSGTNLSLAFHPYHSAIKDAFRFRITNPEPLLRGVEVEVEKIEMIPLIEKAKADEFEKMFHVKALYQHHKDIAQDVFYRTYLSSYYTYRKNFLFLKDRKLLRRLMMGFYPEKEDIEKRPLAKLQQDLWEQAKGIKIKKI